MRGLKHGVTAMHHTCRWSASLTLPMRSETFLTLPPLRRSTAAAAPVPRTLQHITSGTLHACKNALLEQRNRSAFPYPTLAQTSLQRQEQRKFKGRQMGAQWPLSVTRLLQSPRPGVSSVDVAGPWAEGE